MTHTMHCSRGASQGKVVVVIGDVVMLAQAALTFGACHRGTE